MERYDLSINQVRELISRIYEDFRETNRIFMDEMMPEQRVRGGFSSDREHALFLTFVASVDKRKETMGEEGLWWQAKNLWEDDEHNWVYEPQEVVEGHSYAELIDLFRDGPYAQFNYFEDPHVWYLNALGLHRHFDGNPLNMVSAVDEDGYELLKLVQKDKYKDQFHSLTGEKVGRLWVRLLQEELNTIDIENTGKIAIPVDSRIERMTERLTGEEKSNGEIRDFWNGVCGDGDSDLDLEPIKIDKPLWLIDKILKDPDDYEWADKQKVESYFEEQIQAVR